MMLRALLFLMMLSLYFPLICFYSIPLVMFLFVFNDVERSVVFNDVARSVVFNDVAHLLFLMMFCCF